MTRTAKDWLGLAVLLAVPLLLPWAVGRIEPLPASVWPGAAEPARIERVTEVPGFRIQALVHADGRPIHGEPGFSSLPGAVFDRNVQEPLHARGQTQRPVDARLWAFMQGRSGEVYLQQPPLLRDGDAWVAANLRVGGQVQRLLFVEVDDAEHRRLAAKAGAQDWSALQALPASARVLGSVELR